jgi:hypothetical protein
MEHAVDRNRQHPSSWENRIRAIIGDKFVEIFLTSIYRAAGWFVWGLLALSIIVIAAWLVEPAVLEIVIKFFARARLP